MTHFSNRLKTERKRRKLTQQDLADLLHVSRTSISNWEVGQNYPDLEVLVKLSDVLDLSLDHLLKGDTEMVEDYSQKIRTSKKKSQIIKSLVTVLVGILVVALVTLKLFFIGWTATSEEILIDYEHAPNELITIRVGSKKNRRVELVETRSGEMRMVEKQEPFFRKRPQKFSYYSIHSKKDEFSAIKFKDKRVEINWNKITHSEKSYTYQKYPI